MKKLLATCLFAAAARGVSASSGVIELEIPGMNAETAARIADARQTFGSIS